MYKDPSFQHSDNHAVAYYPLELQLSKTLPSTLCWIVPTLIRYVVSDFAIKTFLVLGLPQRAFREELCILLSIINRPICVLCHNF